MAYPRASATREDKSYSLVCAAVTYSLFPYFAMKQLFALCAFAILGPIVVRSETSAVYNVFNPHPDLTRTADGQWPLHDKTRPLPPRAEPRPEAELAATAKAPAGAVILFNGTDVSGFKPTRWKVQNGYLEVTPKSGDLETLASFGSCQLHLEWWTPAESARDGQHRGNSGVFLMSKYEVQVLDTYSNITYADGFAGALYGIKPPDFNALRPPGEWQYYDIEFHRPVFSPDGKLVKPARITIDLNGVRIQDNAEFTGPTSNRKRTLYSPHADRLPLRLQEHNEVVRFRNIWLIDRENVVPAQSSSSSPP